ncbi:hypothetical protein OIU85_007963 [Salix viminalis]|uniref:Uncharacterized protein n=1 Tax=Salix viminalis TaxID=40686 RepID=A0A9Q0P9Z6_SALVM|nr:hypothetical protein OIU85_007963 [Salix viminalis]
MKPKSKAHTKTKNSNSNSLWKWNANDSKKKNGNQFPVPEFLQESYRQVEETTLGPGGGFGIGMWYWSRLRVGGWTRKQLQSIKLLKASKRSPLVDLTNMTMTEENIMSMELAIQQR